MERCAHSDAGRSSPLAWAAACVLVVVAACSSDAGSTPRPTAPPSRPTPAVSADPLAPYVAGSQAVRFPATDGVRLDGRLYRRGTTGVALAHMGGGHNQSDWFGLASGLATRGYTVLTFDRRGTCPGGLAGCSEGNDSYDDSWMDVVGAARFLAANGVTRVFIGGASIGAMASLYAAVRSGVDPAGVIWVAGLVDGGGIFDFHRPDVAALGSPLLIISSQGDQYGAAGAARRLNRWADEPKRLVLAPGDRHGTDMLAPRNPGEADRVVRQAILGFLETYG